MYVCRCDHIIGCKIEKHKGAASNSGGRLTVYLQYLVLRETCIHIIFVFFYFLLVFVFFYIKNVSSKLVVFYTILNYVALIIVLIILVSRVYTIFPAPYTI